MQNPDPATAGRRAVSLTGRDCGPEVRPSGRSRNHANKPRVAMHRHRPVSVSAGKSSRQAYAMATPVEFIGNVWDLCNDNGFQWEFHCNRCDNGFRSPFAQNIASRGRGVLRMAGEWFGGKLETFSQGVEDFNHYGFSGEESATKDQYFAKAVEQVRPNFRQCRGCGRWACAKFCWNNDVGQCLECSPLVEEEWARAQADARSHQLRERAYEQDLVGEIGVDQCPEGGPSDAGCPKGPLHGFRR